MWQSRDPVAGRLRRVGSTAMLVVTLCGSAAAQPEDDASDPKLQKRYISAFAASVDGDDAGSRLGDPGGNFAFGLGGGVRMNPNLALEVDFVFDIRDYDLPEDTVVPLFVSVDDIDLTSAFGFFTVKGIYPTKRVELYIGAGLGLGYSELEMRGRLFLFSGTVEKESEFNVAAQLAAGMNFAPSRRTQFGLELRQIEASASFGALSGGEIDIGGRMLSLTYKFHF